MLVSRSVDQSIRVCWSACQPARVKKVSQVKSESRSVFLLFSLPVDVGQMVGQPLSQSVNLSSSSLAFTVISHNIT